MKRVFWSFIVLWFLASLFGNIYGAGRWSRTSDMNFARGGGEGALLTDGRMMLIGGAHGDQKGFEIFNPATGLWARDTLPHPYAWVYDYGHSMSTLLPNGKVLWKTSGSFAGDNPYIYDPVNKLWTKSDMSNFTLRARQFTTLLKDGRVLINYSGTDCITYDCWADERTITGSTQISHCQGVEVLLPDGKVLLAQGDGGKACELYNPAGGGSWSYTDSCNYDKGDGCVAILLPTPWNKVLLAGGSDKTCEVYNLANNTWVPTCSTNNIHYIGAMILLPSGKPLIIGGQIRKKCEIYDSDFEIWTETDSMEFNRSHFTAGILASGKVLIAGDLSPFAECEIYDPSEPNWTAMATLKAARKAHTVTPLPISHTSTCSTNVLITGGIGISDTSMKSCELYNYMLNTTAYTGSLNTARAYHTTNLLTDGTVLVAGGKDFKSGGGYNILKSCEIWNPTTESWTYTDDLNYTRFDHTATLLEDGRVMVTGGEAASITDEVEIYSGGTWTSAASMNSDRTQHCAVVLLDGRVMVIGGRTSSGVTPTCEIWNGTIWTNVDQLNTARYLHTATLLQSGKVLVVGGKNASGSALTSCEIYDPVGDTWTNESFLTYARYAHNTILLYSGLVLVTGGHDGSNSIAYCEIWDPGVLDPTTNKHNWKITDTLGTARSFHSSVLIPAMKPYVLAIGGENGSSINSIERYDVGLGYSEDWQAVISNYRPITAISDSMNIQGSLFRGVSEADGGNHCHIVSNDHPVVSLLRIGGGNFSGNGGGEVLYMPYSTNWSDSRTIVHPPDSALDGYYRLWTITNGIPCKWYQECAGTSELSTLNSQLLTLKIEPNPFTQKTVISYLFPVIGDQPINDLQIYDLAGRLVKSLPITDYRLPITEVTWDAKDYPTGIYFVTLKAGNTKVTRKLILLK